MCPQITSVLTAVPLCMGEDAQTKVVPKRGVHKQIGTSVVNPTSGFKELSHTEWHAGDE